MKDIFGQEVTKEIIKKEIIENSDIVKILKKYSMLIKEISKKNNPKFVKKSKEKLYYLQNEDDIDISQDFDIICCKQDELRKIIYNLLSHTEINIYLKKIEELKILHLLVNTAADIIYKEYHNLLNKKNIKKDEYFSNVDYVHIAEICDLVENEWCCYNKIYKILSEIANDEALEQYDSHFSLAMCSFENIINYLHWIFSDSDMKERPNYYF